VQSACFEVGEFGAIESVVDEGVYPVYGKGSDEGEVFVGYGGEEGWAGIIVDWGVESCGGDKGKEGGVEGLLIC